MIKNAFGSDQRGKDASRFHPQIVLILDPHFIVKPVNRKFQIKEILFEISSDNLTKNVTLESCTFVPLSNLWNPIIFIAHFIWQS
jgi:hypothetical protein